MKPAIAEPALSPRKKSGRRTQAVKIDASVVKKGADRRR